MKREAGQSDRRRMALTAELVALCDRAEADPGPESGFRYLTEAEFDAAAAGLLKQRLGDDKADCPVGIFAYGSLIWKPEVEVKQRVRARAYGWHRTFSLELTRWRGSPTQKGLMMGLGRGGCCDGVIDYLDPADQAGQIGLLLRREISTPEELSGVRWVSAETAKGRERALAFWAAPTGLDYVRERSLEEVAHILCRACGHIGSGAAYLFETVSKLHELGIRDRNLWRLQQLVAREICELHGCRDTPL